MNMLLAMARWLIVYGISVFSTSLFSQAADLKFTHLTANDGLSHNQVHCSFQDSRGYMWFGTEYGLNRYDGFQFETYVHDPLDANSLSDNRVTALWEDRAGILWVGTRRGLNTFDRENQTFINYGIGYVTSLLVDREGVIWAGLLTGLSRYDAETKQWRYFKHRPEDPNSLSGNSIRKIYEDKSGRLWIASTDGGLCEILRGSDAGDIQFRRYPNDVDPGAQSLLSMCEDAQGRLWLASEGGISLFDPQKGEFQQLRSNPANSLRFSTLCADQSGNIWLGSAEGLYQISAAKTGPYDAHKATDVLRYTHEPNNPFSLSSNEITHIYTDAQGLVWVATAGHGVNLVDTGAILFRQIRRNGTTGLADNNVWSIAKASDGGLWVGTDKGITIVTSQENGTHRFQAFELPGRAKSLPVRAIIVDNRRHTLWMAVQNYGLINYFPHSRRTVTYRSAAGNPDSLQSTDIYTLFQDSKGIIWVGTHDSLGFYQFDPQQKRFRAYRYAARRSETDRWITAICEDSQSGDLWLGTWRDGLVRFDKQSQTLVRYFADPEYPKTLVSAILALHSDPQGNLWIGTNGNGLYRMSRLEGQKPLDYQQYRFEKSNSGKTADEIIAAIAADEEGRLWFGTNRGIVAFNPPAGTFRRYDVNDGLQDNQFNRGAVFRDEYGQIYFGGRNGLSTFFPKNDLNPYPPYIAFAAFKKNGRDVPVDPGRPMELAYDDKYFTFEFLALHFKQPAKNAFNVRMEGFDSDWIPIENRREMTYTILPRGEYTFRVKAANSDGVWSELPAAVRVIVHPPWWQTWWAYLLYAGLAVTGLVALVAIRERNLKKRTRELETMVAERTEEIQKQAEELKKMDRAKSRFFANISHEFRTPLTLISGPVKQLQNGHFRGDIHKQYEVILNNCDRLLQLINQLLDLSKLESGSMKLQTRPEDIASLTRYLTFAFESMAKQKRIDLQFHSTIKTHDGAPVTVYVDREKYEKTITNLLSNALKFTPVNGRVTVLLDLTTHHELHTPNPEDSTTYTPSSGGVNGKCVRIRIMDNGIGISQDQLPRIFDRFYQVEDSNARHYEGTGIGLALTKELVELHKGLISVSSAPGKGTAFSILLPLGRAHLQTEEIMEDTPETPVSENGDAAFATIRLPHPAQAHERIQPSGANDKPAESSKKQRFNMPLPTVLIVDDNADMRTYLGDYLRIYFNVIEAGTGTEGLKQAQKMIPDLIVSDVMMPEMDGMAFCETLKTNLQTSHIPVILLTALAEQADRLKGLETGADDFLTKPFDADELLVRINNLIRQRHLLREKFSRMFTVNPAEITVTSLDRVFLDKAAQIVETHIGNESFNRKIFANKMHMSVRNLNRKLTALTDCSASQFIREYRLKRAKQLLANKTGNITEIALKVGFNNPAYFAKCFTETFGISPSEYIRSNGDKKK